MTNADIASTLEQIADLLEYLGENPFRCRAYRAAARTVLVVTEPLAELQKKMLASPMQDPPEYSW